MNIDEQIREVVELIQDSPHDQGEPNEASDRFVDMANAELIKKLIKDVLDYVKQAIEDYPPYKPIGTPRQAFTGMLEAKIKELGL